MTNKPLKLAVVHFMPLEYYPPITNLLNSISLSSWQKPYKVKVITCKNVKNRKSFELKNNISTSNARCKIYRFPFPKQGDSKSTRLFKYLLFNIGTLIRLVIFNPDKILYYESYSAFPIFIYNKFINRNCQIYIHYHEYESVAAYASMMKTVQLYHKMEKEWLYEKAIWISQTNQNRLQFFNRDHPSISKFKLYTLPNYPPQSWSDIANVKFKSNPVTSFQKIIYVGSLSFHNTYIKEFCDWVIAQKGTLEFDIYAYNVDADVKDYLNNLSYGAINFLENGIEYYQQPAILKEYDVAVILHKAHNENYRFNAPNKLFESLVCQLDVWYPVEMEGINPYNTKNTYPQVIPINFSSLNQFNWHNAIRNENMVYRPFSFHCEDAYKPLIERLLNTN